MSFAIVEAGAVRSAGRIETTPEKLELFAQSLSPADRVALEVTGARGRSLRSSGHVAKVVVVSPADTGIRQARAKTDRLDARALARLLWSGELDPVWVPDEQTRMLRRRLNRREQLVRSRSRAKNEIHAVLMRCLKGKPPFFDLFGVKARKWLSELELPLEEQETVCAAMRHIEFLDTEIAAVEALVAADALQSAQARRLLTVPGVNVLRADVPGCCRRHPPLSDFPRARGLPGLGLTRLPVRRAAGEGRADLKAGLAAGALVAGRGGLVGRSAAWPAARLL